MKSPYHEYLDEVYRKELGRDWKKCFYENHRVPIEFEYFIDDFVISYKASSSRNRFEISRTLDVFCSRVKRKHEGQVTLQALADKYEVSCQRIRQIYLKALRLFIAFLVRDGILKGI